MGRKAYPVDLILLSGNKAHLTKDELQRRKMNEIQIRSKNLECPDYLPDDVKQEWHALVRLYRESGVDILCDLDKNAIEVYCNAAVLYKLAMKKIRETSAVIIKRGSTDPKPNPWIRIAKQERDAMKQFSELLLLEPVSRVHAARAEENAEVSECATAQWFKNRPDELKKY